MPSLLAMHPPLASLDPPREAADLVSRWALAHGFSGFATADNRGSRPTAQPRTNKPGLNQQPHRGRVSKPDDLQEVG